MVDCDVQSIVDDAVAHVANDVATTRAANVPRRAVLRDVERSTAECADDSNKL